MLKCRDDFNLVRFFRFRENSTCGKTSNGVDTFITEQLIATLLAPPGVAVNCNVMARALW